MNLTKIEHIARLLASLYEMGRLSTGAAARLVGVPRSVILTRLAVYGVDTFELTDEKLDEETRFA